MEGSLFLCQVEHGYPCIVLCGEIAEIMNIVYSHDTCVKIIYIVDWIRYTSDQSIKSFYTAMCLAVSLVS